jgi:hypothetical protein
VCVFSLLLDSFVSWKILNPFTENSEILFCCPVAMGVCFLYSVAIAFFWSHLTSFFLVSLTWVGRHNKELVKELSEPVPGSMDLSFPSEYSQPFFQQLKCTLWKQHLTYWRSPDYNLVRVVFTVLTALVFGSLFWKDGSKRWVKH